MSRQEIMKQFRQFDSVEFMLIVTMHVVGRAAWHA